MSYIVYEHVFPNGKRYVGITCQRPSRRWRNGKSYLSNVRMTRAIKKYGWENIQHNILADGLSEEEAEALEIKLIKDGSLQDPAVGYNIADGGSHSRCSEETKKKIGAKTRNNRHTEAYKRWISERNSGAGNYMYGKHHSEETKRKISEARRGGTSVNKGKFGGDHPSAKAIVAVDPVTGEEKMMFRSIIDAADAVGIASSCIKAALAGKQHTSAGYGWKYAEQKLH